ncbi:MULTISPECIES: hypothetical protein [Salinibaculum]|uniref:hypothetical protein n=1 Tax=Salinibaculum TaxID=2732368 RepID=UPI0030D06D7D
MQAYDDGADKPHDSSTDLDQRDVRALTEKMTVLPRGGDVYSVTTESGSEYRVDALEGRCSCPDKQHNLSDDERCKHERRVRFATGQWQVPAWVDTEAVDPQLGEHVETTAAAADGGVIPDDNPQPQTEENRDERDSDSGRPDDCECTVWNGDYEIPCWECYREGFEEPVNTT